MLKLTCLLKNVPATEHIRDAIKILVGQRMETSGIATFPEVYNDLRKANVEIDAESAGALYDGLYGHLNDESLSTTEEVEEFAGKDFQRQIKAVVDEINGETTKPGQQQLGLSSPEKHAVNSISKLFQNAMFGASPRTSSILRQMQDFVTKAAISKLPPQDKKKAVGLTDSLDAFFNLEDNKFKRLDGQVNTLEDLHKAVKKEVDEYVDQAADKLGDDEADLFRQQWEEYTQSFMDSAYDIVLGKGNQNSLVNESLKQIEIDGKNIVDLNGNVKWSALVEHDNPDEVSQKVKQLFKDGFKEKDGSHTKYTDAQAERIGEYFQRIYEEKLDDAKRREATGARAKNQSAKNIISDFIRDEGFFNLVKDKLGKITLTQADWNGILKKVKEYVEKHPTSKDNLGNVIAGMDLVKQRLHAFLNATDSNGKPKYDFTPRQIKMIEDEFVNTVLAKLKPTTAEAASMERMIALDKLNQGKAFKEETQQAVNKVVGVGKISQTVLDQLKVLTQLAQSIISGNGVVNNSTNTNPNVNRGAYAFTAIAEVDRKIKQILRQFKIDSSIQQRVAKYMADLMGGGTVSLLINPNNMTENVFTQTATNIGESVTMMFTNPKLFWKTFGQLQGDYWTQWLNYAQGGASNEIANESDLSSDLQSSERLRVRGVIDEFKNQPFFKALTSTVLKSPQTVISIISRTFMNSFDAATTTSLMRKKTLQSVYDGLKIQGLSGEDALKAMDKIFDIPPAISKEIEIENKKIGDLLKAAGFPVNDIMMAQNARDMRMSVYEDIIRDQTLKAGVSLGQATEITKALIESSQQQAKELGGKRKIPTEDVISSIIYGIADYVLKPQKNLFESTRNAEKEGKFNKAARLQFAASVYQNFFGKFVGGVANFMNLALTATPTGFYTAYQIKSQLQQYDLQHPGAHDITKASPEEIKKYAELHGIMKSVFTRAIMGSAVMAAFITKALINRMDDDDDEDRDSHDWFANLMATKTGRRFIQKHMPLGVAMAAPWLYKSGEKKEPMSRVFDMINTYTGRDFETYNNLTKGLDYSKTDEDRKEVWSKFFGNMITSYNVNQPEQIIKFKDAVQSMLDSKNISDVKENEKISKNIYKQAEGLMDNFLINGAIDAIRRTHDQEQHYNRFIKRDDY